MVSGAHIKPLSLILEYSFDAIGVLATAAAINKGRYEIVMLSAFAPISP